MSKLIAKEITEIKTVVDNEDLLNLNELIEKEKVYKHLEYNLHNYKKNYFKSFLKTIDEVLDYIPEKHHKLYNKGEKEGKFIDYLKNLTKNSNKINPGKVLIINTISHEVIFHHEEYNEQHIFSGDFNILNVIFSMTHCNRFNFGKPEGETVITYSFDAKTNKLVNYIKKYYNYWMSHLVL